MRLHISPYLQWHLQIADSLPDQFPDIPEAVVQHLQARIRKLVALVAARDETVRKLQLRLDAEFGTDDDVAQYEGICDGCAQSISECLCDVDLEDAMDCNSPFHPGCRKCAVEPPRDEDR